MTLYFTVPMWEIENMISVRGCDWIDRFLHMSTSDEVFSVMCDEIWYNVDWKP